MSEHKLIYAQAHLISRVFTLSLALQTLLLLTSSSCTGGVLPNLKRVMKKKNRATFSYLEEEDKKRVNSCLFLKLGFFSRTVNTKRAERNCKPIVILAIDFPLGKRNFITRQMTRAATKNILIYIIF